MRDFSTHAPSPVMTLGEIALVVEGRLQGEGHLTVRGVAQPDQAASDEQLVLVLDQQGRRALIPSNASCALVAADIDSIETSLSNVDFVRIKKQISYKYYSNREQCRHFSACKRWFRRFRKRFDESLYSYGYACW